jgi:hypothetical protein
MTSLLIPLETGAVAPVGEKARLETGKRWLALRCRAFAVAVGATLLLPSTTLAFPPAPRHLIYGTVKDQYGNPLMTDQAQVILITPTGVQLVTSVVPGLDFQINYELEVPMDAGLTADPYEPNALMAGASFTMLVVLGGTTNLPIQMAGNLSQLGQPGAQNRIDLTLGVDSNGDGLPDAWELAYLSELGSSLGLANINANSIIGPNGLTLLQEFLAGYYPSDPTDNFTLRLLNVGGGSALLQFTATTGRYYSLLGSSDLRSWVPLSFRIPAEGSNGAIHSFYYSQGIQTLQLQTLPPGGNSPPTLSFTRTGSQLTLSWPTNSAGFTLVSSSSLTSPSWQPVNATPFVVGNNYVLSNAPAGPGQFFRLSSTPLHFFRLVLQ